MNPVPDYIQKALSNPKSNFSLIFPRLVNWKDVRDGIEKDESAIETLCTKSKNRQNINELLNKKHEQQKEFIKSVGGCDRGYEIEATLVSPFITGLGSGHPTETGMILDRNTGSPYIPASSIKGVLRTAYAIQIADEKGEADDTKIAKIFGSSDVITDEAERSKVIFLDAYPTTMPTIQNDILNPHYGKYYSGDRNLPIETDNPIPVKFLSVTPGCTFVFRYVIIDEKSVKPEDIEKAFETALSVVGFGGKTAMGYGRFENPELKKQQDDAKKEAEKKQKELQEFDKQKDKYLERNKNKDEDKVIGVVTSINNLKVKVPYKNNKTQKLCEEEFVAAKFNGIQLNDKVYVNYTNWLPKAPKPESVKILQIIKNT